MTSLKAEGEDPQKTEDFVLTASIDAYQITRTPSSSQEILVISRSDLPDNCEVGHFFLNDLSNELKIAEPSRPLWVSETSPPSPDDHYPPCAILVSYGTFSEPIKLKGVAVTTSSGLIASQDLPPPQPAFYALLPFAVAADFYIVIGAVITLPIWAPIGLWWAKSQENTQSEMKEREKRGLPASISACWTAIDAQMEKEGSFENLHKFEWSPKFDDSYLIRNANKPFNEDGALPVEELITLR